MAVLGACLLGVPPMPAWPVPAADSPPATASGLEARLPELPIRPDMVTAEMSAWAAGVVPSGLRSFDRLALLLKALQYDPTGPRIRYVEGHTATAEEAFGHGRINCLAYSHLVVALARELEIDAFYMDVSDRETYRKEGDLVIVAGHVTVGFDDGPDRRILEFQVGPDVDYRRAERITDAMARAYYHSNRGAELLRDGDAARALPWLEAAVELEPELPDAWVNLGVAARRLGQPDRAESAYRRAIEVEDDFLPAYQNLAALYHLRGDRQGATELLDLLDRFKTKNPFVYLALGDLSFERGALDEAERFYRRGRRLGKKEPELMVALGGVAAARGDLERARVWLDRALEQDPENSRVRRFEERLATASGAAQDPSD